MKNKFYVYALLDPRKPGQYKYGEWVFDHEPFYIGKGHGNRIDAHLHEAIKTNNNTPKLNKIRKIIRETGDNHSIIIIEDNLYEVVALEMEKFLIQQIGRLDLKSGPLTNLTDGGNGGGCNPSEETRRKIGKYMLGKTLSEQTKLKMSAAKLGKTLSEQTKRRMSAAKNNMTEETKLKIRDAHLGKFRSDEHKHSISIVTSGENNPMFGKTHSDETKLKMSVASKKAWKKRKEILSCVD